MTVASLSVCHEELLRRICSEFLEMPGLRLTLEQACRLWGLDRDTCRTLLAELVSSRFLTLTPDGQFARVSEGPLIRRVVGT